MVCHPVARVTISPVHGLVLPLIGLAPAVIKRCGVDACGVLDGRYHSGPAWFWCCHGGCGWESAFEAVSKEMASKVREFFMSSQHRIIAWLIM